MKKLLKRLTAAALLVLAVAAACVVFSPRPALYPAQAESTLVMDRDGEMLSLSLANDERYRLPVKLGAIAPELAQATVLYEDRFFFEHWGVNPAALIRAAVETYARRVRPVGGSTISMQVVRLRDSLNTRSPAGKIQQLFLALQLERHYTKEEILEAYLNLAPYGGNIEGVGAAAQIFFGKPAADLNLLEALTLAVVPQNPVERYPVRASDGLIDARARLARTWSEHYPEATIDEALARAPIAVRIPGELPHVAPHLTRRIVLNYPPGSYKTTIDYRLQLMLEREIRVYTRRFDHAGIRNATAILIDNERMELLASVGSADFFDATIDGQVDGTLALRSPGSTLKPFVYALAIDRGVIHPHSMLEDTPLRYRAFAPENFDREFAGPILAKDALIYSRNVPAVSLLEAVGQQEFHDFLARAGVIQPKPASFYGLASVLGGNELRMTEIAQLYASLANAGQWRALRYLPDTPDQQEPVRLLTPEAAFLTLNMLQGNPRPGAQRPGARVQARPAIAWKTGTSYAFRDAWTVGVFGRYTLAVWVGNFDGSSNNAFVGRRAGAPLFFNMADALGALERVDAVQPLPPAALNLAKVPMCRSTGDLAGQLCPDTEPGWIIPGVSPIRTSSVHQQIAIDSLSGLRACHYDPQTTALQVFEIWPSNVRRVMKQAGVYLPEPPPWADECSFRARAGSGTRPRIVTPASGAHYRYLPGDPDRNQLTLRAIADGNARRVHWLINGEFVGVAPAGEDLTWRLRPGAFEVVAIDDAGRANQAELIVR